MTEQWTKVTSEYSCDKCGRDNTYEVDVFSRSDCPQILCPACATEWENWENDDAEQAAETLQGEPNSTLKGSVTMTTYERQAHDKAVRLSKKHQDEYYVMRDHTRLDWETDAFYVVSGSRFDSGLAELESSAVQAAYAAGQRLPDFD